MNLTKSYWAADENHVSLAVPFAKVDQENRLVSGWATMDNIDTSDDIVVADASGRAFARFRGNIREMHQPIAAGRLVDFKEDSFYDSETEKFYNGIYVTAYVSKGAQATWEKVLDGTLSGFSIGGNILDASTEFSKDANKSIRFIKDYELVELSLVDNPANQKANVLSVVKNSEGTFLKGMMAETEVITVFWCPTDEIAKNSSNETEDCLACGNRMEQIGWFERGEDAVAKTAQAVAGFLRQKEGAVTKAETANDEGGVKMSDNVDKDNVVDDQAPVVQQEAQERYEETKSGADDGVVTSEDVSQQSAATEEVKPEANADEAKVTAEVDAEPDFEKMFDDLKNSVSSSIANTVEQVEKRVQEVTSAFDTKASEFEKAIGELSEKLDGIKTEREGVAKRLDALEKSSAIKKSGEVETEPVKKTRESALWSGTFFQ